MIFFTQHIEPFESSTGMMVSPTPCTLTDNRQGFYFVVEKWNEQLIERGAILEQITKEDLKIQEE